MELFRYTAAQRRSFRVAYVAREALKIACKDPDNIFEASLHRELGKVFEFLPNPTVGEALKLLVALGYLEVVGRADATLRIYHRLTPAGAFFGGFEDPPKNQRVPLATLPRPEPRVETKKAEAPRGDLEGQLMSFWLSNGGCKSNTVKGLVNILRKEGVSSKLELFSRLNELNKATGMGTSRRALLQDFVSSIRQISATAA